MLWYIDVCEIVKVMMQWCWLNDDDADGVNFGDGGDEKEMLLLVEKILLVSKEEKVEHKKILHIVSSQNRSPP